MTENPGAEPVKPAAHRVVDAVGAAAQLPTSLALLLAAVPAENRTRATRNWAAVGGLDAAAGPVAGGLLVQVDWRWVFVINVPIAIATVVAGLRVLPRTTRREEGRLPDMLGALLVTVAVAALSGGLVQAPDWGWLNARTLVLFAVALVTATAFTIRSLRHSHPLFELHLLRLPRFGTANIGTFVFGVAFAIMLLSNVLWCQEVRHWSVLRTGVAMVPGPALVPVVTLLTARAAQRLGHGPLITVGGPAVRRGDALAGLLRVYLFGRGHVLNHQQEPVLHTGQHRAIQRCPTKHIDRNALRHD
ncbi:MFS transporter [Streptomyces sp. NPDC057280]|uniref:MFS transporter n=1 Tax=Streptomyces sp. NPDC057280 TaxID=3346081 RepID=UPI003641A108